MGGSREDPAARRNELRDELDVDAATLHEMLAQGHEWAAQAGGRKATRHRAAARVHRQAARRTREPQTDEQAGD